jgi:hypothetical protein
MDSNQRSDGGFGGRACCFCRGARNWFSYCRTIAAAGFGRMPTAPRSSTKALSTAMRLMTSSGVNIAAIPPPLEDARGVAISVLKVC